MAIKTSPGCDCGAAVDLDCTRCLEGTRPTQMEVVIGGIVDDVCSNCDTTVNGTYVLDETGNKCNYRYLDTGGFGCADGFEEITLQISGTTTTTMLINITAKHWSGDTVSWQSRPYDPALGAQSCDFNSVDAGSPSGGASPANSCDYSNATCQFSAL